MFRYLITFPVNFCFMLSGETMLIFWSTSKIAQKIGSVSRKNKNNII